MPSALINTLQATDHFAKNVNRGAFTTVVKDVVKTASPFLSVFSSVVKLVFGIGSASSQSEELIYLHKLSDSINQRFDEVNVQFSEVKNLIRWSVVQTTYASLEANIHVVFAHFRHIFEVSPSGINQQKASFINIYERIYDECGSKLFAGFMLDNGLLSQGILRPAMKFTENDRGQMRIFMLGILKLLLMAANVELGYKVTKGYDHIIPFYSHQWQVRFEQVQAKMEEIDLELKNNYLVQSLKDIDKFSLNNFRLSNQNFSRDLYRELSNKYFWRDWLVIVSTHTQGRVDAHSRVCSSGVIKSTQRTKDLVIDSVEKDKPSFDINEVHRLCESLDGTCKNTATYIPCAQQNGCAYPYLMGCQPGSSSNSGGSDCVGYNGIPCDIQSLYGKRIRRCGSYTNSEDADDIFHWFTTVRTSCSTYSSIGVIAINKNPVYTAGNTGNNSSRLYVHNLSICEYKVHFFG